MSAFGFFFQFYEMSDLTGVLKRLSLARATNAGKVAWSYYRSRQRGRARILGKPVSISIEPTTACNLGCTECPSGLKQFTRPTGNLDPMLFESIIDQLKEHLVYLTLYFQGEPFIHKGFLELVRIANQQGIYTSTSTNGHFLSEDNARGIIESGLSRLIISIDGTDQATYEKYRVNGNLSTVIEGVKRLEEMKKRMRSSKPFTEIQFIAFRHNEDQIPEMRKLFKELGSDKLIIKTAQIYDFESKNEIIPQNGSLSRYERDEQGEYVIKNKLLDHCWRMWHSCVITWDGKVVPCCFDKDASHVFGDLKEQSFDEIWYGPRYNEFRNSLLKSRSEIEICTNCTEGTKVQA